IPQSLRDAGFATAQSIQDALAKRLGKTDIAGMKLYNVSLMYSEDEGKTWLKAVSEHYPEDGRIIVTMPVPDGSDPTTHAYAVSHMFETNAFGKKAGGIETPEVSVFYNDEGQPMLRFETTGLSPVLVVWNAQNPQADLPATGDDSHIGASIAIMLVSLLSLAIISRKKRQTC
ncbi:MAG: LPXTG cell wall anchor domain-containing protein, partial [Clostridia bacterium]|nr:LPXTG cell wall anchor domain-containing protein [Clostridia bacterium]